MLLNKFLAKLKGMFEHKTYGEELEEFIISKNPTTSYDVDYWTRQYDAKMTNKSVIGWTYD